MAGLAAAFHAFAAKGKNQRWSWSARTPDGRIVMTFWQDQFPSGNPLCYSNIGNRRLAEWQDQLGNQERIQNLIWARDHWEGQMGVVIVRAVDIAAIPRRIAAAFPRKNLLMQLTELRETTGEFSAVNVGKWAQLRASEHA
jgi:hypothetical protein